MPLCDGYHARGGVRKSTAAVSYDPYDVDIARDPYPTYRRLRAEAPHYNNDVHESFAASLFADCDRGLSDWQTFRLGCGGILELIKSGIELPPGTLGHSPPPADPGRAPVISRRLDVRPRLRSRRDVARVGLETLRQGERYLDG